MTDIGPASEIPPGTVTERAGYAVGNNGDYFAVTRRCRHLGADLSDGSIGENGCLVCPWHAAEYDVRTGRMTRGPQGVFAKIPGLGAMFMGLTRVRPLGRRTATNRDGRLMLDD